MGLSDTDSGEEETVSPSQETPAGSLLGKYFYWTNLRTILYIQPNNDGQIVHPNVALIFPNLLMTILYILYYTDYIKWVMTLTQRTSIPSCWCQKAAGKLFFSWLTKTQKQGAGHMEYDKTLDLCTSLVHFTRVQRDIALYSSACNVISWGSARLILLLLCYV